MFEYLFLAFFLSLGEVPFFFLGGSPSIGRPPPPQAKQVRREGPQPLANGSLLSPSIQ